MLLTKNNSYRSDSFIWKSNTGSNAASWAPAGVSVYRYFWCKIVIVLRVLDIDVLGNNDFISRSIRKLLRTDVRSSKSQDMKFLYLVL